MKYGKQLACDTCGNDFNYARVKNRRSYQCNICSNQVYPTVNTIFEKSTTPLTYWFYAIYLHTVCKNGVAAKELERQLNVCYKTALRMAHQIKILMTDTNNRQFFGEVVADESFFGGLNINKHKGKKKKGTGSATKDIAVFGIIDYTGKRFYSKVMPVEQIKGEFLKPIVADMVNKSATLITDTFGGYYGLNKNYNHIRINHSADEFVKNGFSTNRIENFWSGIKRQIKGTHIAVSPRHLHKYVSEYAFRYTHRDQQRQMLDIILSRI